MLGGPAGLREEQIKVAALRSQYSSGYQAKLSVSKIVSVRYGLKNIPCEEPDHVLSLGTPLYPLLVRYPRRFSLPVFAPDTI